jgi:hypothetical protein
LMFLCQTAIFDLIGIDIELADKNY